MSNFSHKFCKLWMIEIFKENHISSLIVWAIKSRYIELSNIDINSVEVETIYFNIREEVSVVVLNKVLCVKAPINFNHHFLNAHI